MEEILRILSLVPNVIWSGAIGAIIGGSTTFLGTWLQNRAHYKRHKEQLNHDAEQRREEREMDVRREVYLKAAESTARLQEFLANFTRIDITHGQSQDSIKGVWAELNKARIIGGLEVIESLSDLRKVFTNSVLSVTEKRQAVDRCITEISGLQSRIQEIDKRIEQFINVIQAAADSKQAHLIENLAAKFESYTELADHEKQKHYDQLEILNQELQVAQKELMEEVSRATQQYSQTVVGANLAIRREIKFEIDSESYKSTEANTGEEIRKEVKDRWIKK